MLIRVGQLRFRHQVLILLASIIVVVMVSVIAVAAPQLFESERRTAFERLRSVSSLKALWLLREIEELESGLQAIAEDERLIDEIRFLHQLLPFVESYSPLFQTIANNDRGDDPLAGDRLSLYWQTIDRIEPSFGYLESSLPGAQLYIVRPADGLISFSLNQNKLLMVGLSANTETNSRLWQCYQRALAEPRQVVLEDFNTEAGSDGLACAGTVMRHQGQVLAVVLQEFPVSLFNNIMTMNTGLGQTGESYLVGTDKLLRTDSRHYGSGSLFDTFVDSRPVREGLAGFSGEADVLDYRREDVSAVWQAITLDNIRWSLVVKMDKNEIFRQLYRNVAALSAVWFVLLVLLAVIAIGFANRIERPLRTLLKNAQKIAGGDYSQLVRRSEGAKELTELFDMFNLMATEIHEHTDALESARTRAELASEEAERATQAKSEFLSRMSHELRTPLNGVLGYAQLLRRDQSLGAEQRDTLEAIQNCGQHLLELINDVLDLSKIEAGQLDINLQPVDLAQVLQRVVDVVTPRADEKGLLFERTLPKVDITVSLDATKFRQVLINLLGNAVKFTQQGAVRLTVHLNDAQHLIECTVEDTGPGIEAENIERIFQPFGQTGTGKDAGGAGLGLSISKQLCEAMSGEISVESEPGQGTTFYFTIPLHIERRQAVHLPDLHLNERLLSQHDTTLKALVADDVAVNRDLLSQLLESYGFEVYGAENGQQAVDLWQQHQFPLVLMDLRMPLMDGFEATRRIRALQGDHTVAICAVSANVQAQTAEKALQSGFDEFFAKPVDVSQLLSFISQHCELHFAEKVLEEELGPSVYTLSREDNAKLSALLRQMAQCAASGDIAQVKQLLADITLLAGEQHEHTVALKRLCDQFLMMDIAAYCQAVDQNKE